MYKSTVKWKPEISINRLVKLIIVWLCGIVIRLKNHFFCFELIMFIFKEDKSDIIKTAYSTFLWEIAISKPRKKYWQHNVKICRSATLVLSLFIDWVNTQAFLLRLFKALKLLEESTVILGFAQTCRRCWHLRWQISYL